MCAIDEGKASLRDVCECVLQWVAFETGFILVRIKRSRPRKERRVHVGVLWGGIMVQGIGIWNFGNLMVNKVSKTPHKTWN